jgi:hypothetical protein
MVLSNDDSLIDLHSRGISESSGHLSTRKLSQASGAMLVSQLLAGARAFLTNKHSKSWDATQHVTSSATKREHSKPIFVATPRDGEILALLLPAMLAVFLDPSMGAIDLGKDARRCHVSQGITHLCMLRHWQAKVPFVHIVSLFHV